LLVGNMKKFVICAAAMLLAAGCAKRPEEIIAAAVPAESYMQMQCAQLASLKVQKEAELGKLSEHQAKVAEHDKAAMYVLHVPMGTITQGDKEEQVARAKGEVQAINTAYQSKNCAAGG
jgi:starvation-inducible outer membrane lipoprotein